MTSMPPSDTDVAKWQDQAACRGLRTALFFHLEQERGPTRRRREAEAKAVCHRCPVIEVCRQRALQVQEPYGSWGGLSAEKADQLRAQRRTASVLGAGR